MSETATPTTANLIQTAQAQLLQFQTVLTYLNASLTAIGVTVITPSPTVATTSASIAAVAL